MEEDIKDQKEYIQSNGLDEDFPFELEEEFMSDFESDEEEDYTTYYSCNICGAGNMVMFEFLQHSKMHPQEERKKILDKLVDYKLVEEGAARNAAAAYGFTVQSSVDSSVPLFYCTVCNQGNLLLKHLTEHSSLHPRSADSHFCNLCQKQFMNLRTLNKHLEIHLDANDLFCQYCNKKFNLIEDLEYHENSHYRAEFVCAECRLSFQTKSSIMEHLTLDHSTDNFCQICACVFEEIDLLKRHFVNHTVIRAVKRVIKWFPCETCPKKYDNKASLQRHNLFLHNSRMPLVCEECGYTTFHEASLNEHIIKEHSEESKIIGKTNDSSPCKFCGEVIAQKELETHLELHKNDKFCYLCEKSFKTQWLLNKHINKVHTGTFKPTDSDSGVYPYRCILCPASFRLDFELETHWETHEEISFQCHLCLNEFSKDSELQSHLKTHNDKDNQYGETGFAKFDSI